MKVSAIVLANSKTKQHYDMTAECLRTLRMFGGRDWNVVVVDQNPIDQFNDRGCLVIQPPDGKFHYNRFLRYGWEALNKGGEVLAVLNNDLVFQPGFWEPLKEGLKSFHSVSPWCPQYHDTYMPAGQLYYTGYRAAYEIAGWALFLNRSVIERVGFEELFPEDFAAWYQDNWYAYQLQRNDLTHALVSTSRVVHLFGGSKSLITSDMEADWDQRARASFDAKVDSNRGDRDILLTVGVLGVPNRLDKFTAIYGELQRQAEGKLVEVLALTDNKKSTVGRKRDYVVQMARGRYISFVDDDDEVAPTYVDDILEQIKQHPEVDVITFQIALRGDTNGVTYYSEDNRDDYEAGIFYRKPNHLCAWKTSIAKKTRYRDVSYGEDHDWGHVACSMIRERVDIPKPLYIYNCTQAMSEAQRPSTRMDRQERPEEEIPKLLPALIMPPEHNRLKVAVYTIAKDEIKHAKRWADSARDADLRFVADTGSTDGTQEALLKAGVAVADISISPWRFDTARNAALALLPNWIDVCVSMDMDETLEPGWRRILEDAWKPETTRLNHTFKFSDQLSYRGNRVHARHGYHWKWPIHELAEKCGAPEICAEALDFTMVNRPDLSKSRSQYLGILKDAAAGGDCRMLWYLGREYAYNDMWVEAREVCEKFLRHPEATWEPERWEALRRISRSWKVEKNYDRAVSTLIRASLDYPKTREVLVDLAQLYHDLGNYASGYATALEALSNTARPFHFLVDPECWGYLPHDLAAICAWHIGAKEASAKHATDALANSPPSHRIDSLQWCVNGKRGAA